MTATDPTPTSTTTAKPKRRWLWPAATVGALFLGVAVGGAGAGGETPEPEVRTETETVTETVEVAVVPAECLAALDDADGLLAIASEFATQTSTAMGIARDAVLAAGTFDVAGLTDATDRLLVVTDEINALTAEVQVSTYATNRDSCRAAG
jgi:hypothetical protein